MKNVQEIQTEYKKNKRALFERSDVVREVQGVVDALKAKDIANWTGDELSRAATKLSMFLVNLGQMVTESELIANSAYMYRKWKRAGEFSRLSKKLDKGVTYVKEIIDKKVVEEVEQELESRYVADSLRALYDDAERLVSVIQTRLRVMSNEEIRMRSST